MFRIVGNSTDAEAAPRPKVRIRGSEKELMILPIMKRMLKRRHVIPAKQLYRVIVNRDGIRIKDRTNPRLRADMREIPR